MDRLDGTPYVKDSPFHPPTRLKKLTLERKRDPCIQHRKIEITYLR